MAVLNAKGLRVKRNVIGAFQFLDSRAVLFIFVGEISLGDSDLIYTLGLTVLLMFLNFLSYIIPGHKTNM